MVPAFIPEKIIRKFPKVALVPPKEKFVLDPDLMLQVPAPQICDVCQFLKEDSELRFDLPLQMTAVDYLTDGFFELIYILYSTTHHHAVVIKSQISRADAEIDSVSPIWDGMNWQEREVYDLFGVRFRNHPELKRILMWEGFPGFPLRKDYRHHTDKYDSGLEVGTPGHDIKGLPTKKE